MIVDELLPKLYAEYRISRDPDRHGIAGWSSGAIAGFTVAWQRPDQFRKVLSGIGTYVDLRRRARVPEKVMASERKPIRIFMIDGRNDNRGVNADGTYDPTRDWFYQNVRLKDALVAKGYDVNYAWGIGVHSHDMGGAMLPRCCGGSGATSPCPLIRTTWSSGRSVPQVLARVPGDSRGSRRYRSARGLSAVGARLCDPRAEDVVRRVLSVGWETANRRGRADRTQPRKRSRGGILLAVRGRVAEVVVAGAPQRLCGRLDRAVWKNRAFRERNPGGAAGGYLYVGVTGLSPEARFQRHRAGTQSGRFVRTHGLRLRLDLVEGFSRLPYRVAACMEPKLAAWLRAQGFAVWQN